MSMLHIFISVVPIDGRRGGIRGVSGRHVISRLLTDKRQVEKYGDVYIHNEN